ncbi:CIA30 family protein [Nonlabens sp.]|uniref:CIA30 family protein n=1 Tax=Nonlabens sp. TaxID=1888209 RepID=UPI001BCDE98F|nr:CIA30 family protein [Nonlabens sp.]
MKKAIKFTPKEIFFGMNQYRYRWITFNDTLTGGKSTSKLEQQQDWITYSGIIRNINNSAWSCMRSNKIEQDLSDYSLIEIKLKTDGRPYAFEIEYNEGWQNEKLVSMIYTLPHHWTTVQLPIHQFKHAKLRQILDKKLDESVLNHVLRYNFHVAEEITGPFQLDIECIRFI